MRILLLSLTVLALGIGGVFLANSPRARYTIEGLTPAITIEQRTSTRSGGSSALASSLASDMPKQPPCEAARSSSGLVLPSAAPMRRNHDTAPVMGRCRRSWDWVRRGPVRRS